MNATKKVDGVVREGGRGEKEREGSSNHVCCIRGLSAEAVRRRLEQRCESKGIIREMSRERNRTGVE